MSSNAMDKMLLNQLVELQGRIEALEKIQIRAVEVLKPAPDDVLIITMPNNAPADAMRSMQQGFKSMLPDTKMVCLRECISVRIVRPSDIASVPKEELVSESAIVTE